jgi:hypothetical protein
MNLARVLTTGLGLLAAAAGATPPATTPPVDSVAASTGPAVAGGLIFTLPGEEGRTDELVGELLLDPAVREALRTDSEGLVEERMPDGSVRVDLRGRFQNVVVARLNDTGRVRLDHVARPIGMATNPASGPVCEEVRGTEDEVRP